MSVAGTSLDERQELRGAHLFRIRHRLFPGSRGKRIFEDVHDEIGFQIEQKETGSVESVAHFDRQFRKRVEHGGHSPVVTARWKSTHRASNPLSEILRHA